MPNEGFNPFPGFVSADSTCALQNVNTDGLDIGCLAKTPRVKNRAGDLTGCGYFRLDESDPAPAVTGGDVLATYNSGMPLQQDGVTPCAVVEPSAHSLRGTQRWIYLAIVDVADLL